MHGAPDAQSLHLCVTLLRFISREEETPAGLALISSLRKRLSSLPEDMAADVMWRVRLRNMASGTGCFQWSF